MEKKYSLRLVTVFILSAGIDTQTKTMFPQRLKRCRSQWCQHRERDVFKVHMNPKLTQMCLCACFVTKRPKLERKATSRVHINLFQYGQCSVRNQFFDFARRGEILTDGQEM